MEICLFNYKKAARNHKFQIVAKENFIKLTRHLHCPEVSTQIKRTNVILLCGTIFVSSPKLCDMAFVKPSSPLHLIL